MSIFDELLILIDDQVDIRLEKIESYMNHYSRQAIGSSLGRLVSRGWLTRIVNGQGESYRISESGNAYISQILAAIHRSEADWDSTWFCVLTILPEKERKQRDLLRHYLTGRGYGRLVDGLWITPWNRQEEVGTQIRRLAIGSSVLMFMTQAFGQATVQMVVKAAWNWSEVERELLTYLADASARLETIHERARQVPVDADEPIRIRHQAKCLVFDYGLLLSGNPNLPLAIVPDSKHYQTARSIYDQVRQYCY